MSTEANKTLARRVFDDVLNRHDLEILDELVVPDYVEHNPLPGQGTGIEGIRDRYSMIFDAFDATFEVDAVIAEGDRVVVRWVQAGTHIGTFLGMPATGRSYRTSGIEIWRVEHGRLAEHWDAVDVFGLLAQLGLLPLPAAG